MSEPKTQQEPTMEEILASIRRIISEDGDEADRGAAKAAPAPAPVDDLADDDADDFSVDAAPVVPPPTISPPRPAPRPAPTAEKAGEGDVLELTQVVQDDGSVVDLEDELEEELEEAALDEAVEQAPEVDDMKPAFGPAFGGEAPAPTDEDWGADAAADAAEALISPDVAAMASAAFQRVGALAMGDAGSHTVEDLIKELLRPMLKAWLDENLPSVVERLVAEEIARVARGGKH